MRVQPRLDNSTIRSIVDRYFAAWKHSSEDCCECRFVTQSSSFLLLLRKLFALTSDSLFSQLFCLVANRLELFLYFLFFETAAFSTLLWRFVIHSFLFP